MKKILSLLLIMTFVAGFLYAADEITAPRAYDVILSANIEPGSQDTGNDDTEEVNADGIFIQVGYTTEGGPTVGSQYVDGSMNGLVANVTGESNNIAVDLTGTDANTPDQVYFFVVARAYPENQTSATVSFSCEEGFKLKENSNNQEAIPVTFNDNQAFANESKENGYKVTTTASAGDANKSVTFTLSTEYANSETEHTVGKTTASWTLSKDADSAYLSGDYEATVKVSISTTV